MLSALTRSRSRHVVRAHPSGRPAVEPLEERRLFVIGDSDVFVQPYALADVIDPNQTMLVIEGTTGRDDFRLYAKAGGAQVSVRHNGQKIGTFDVGARAIVMTGSGEDKIRVFGHIPNLILNGGRDADDIKGGSASEVILGAYGSDNLRGGRGRDIIIGGRNADTVKGGFGEDVLTGGSTVWDQNNPALEWDYVPFIKLMTEWQRTDLPYTTRIQSIQGQIPGLNDTYRLDQDSVFSGAVPADRLKGNGRRDIFFISRDPAIDGAQDRVLDRKSNESLVLIEDRASDG